MKRLLYIACVFMAIATACYANDKKLVFLGEQAKWDAMPVNKQQHGITIIEGCSVEGVKFGWAWGLRSKTDPNKVYGFTLYSGDAFVLRKRNGGINEPKINQIEGFWGPYDVTVKWVTNFPAYVESKGLEWIPTPEPPE